MKISETTTVPVQILESDRRKLPEAVLCRVVYPVCNIGELNANNRVYEREVWETVLQDEAICKKLESRTLFGQAEHPAETQSDLQLTSHTIFEMWIDEDNRVYQKMDVLDTPTGRIVDTLLRAGCQVGVSTRAEGDLEEFELEEGKTAQRVIPESYRYVTTDFTADPSTFNVEPIALQRNVVPALQREMESKEGGPLAKALLESIQPKKGKKDVDEAHTSVAVTADDGTQVSVEAEGGVTTTTDPDGRVTVTPVSPALGNTGLGMPAVEPEGEMPPEGEVDQMDAAGPLPVEPEEEMPEGKISKQEVARFGPKGAGKRSKKSEEGMPESRVNELLAKIWPKDLSKKSVAELKAAQTEIRDDRESDNLPFSKAEARKRLSAIAAELKRRQKKEPKAEESKFQEDRQTDDVAPAGDTNVTHEAEVRNWVNQASDDEIRMFHTEFALVELPINEIRDNVGEWLDAADPEELEVAALWVADATSKDTRGSAYESLVDLQVEEASVRAERDALLEAAQKDGDAGLQVRILADRLKKVQESSTAEIDGLRRILEKKAQEAGISKQQLEEAIASRKSEAELNAIHTAHQEELVKTANEAKAEARLEMLTDYFDRQLAGKGLQVDENSRALLESCQNLGDVDALLDKLVEVARRSALHAKPLNEVKVQNVEPMDPEQRKVNTTVGSLMKHIG